MGGRPVGGTSDAPVYKIDCLRVSEVRDQEIALHLHDLVLAGEAVSAVSTSRFKIRKEPLRSCDPRENFVHNIFLRHLAFDVRERTITEGLNFELNLTPQRCI